LTLFASDMAAGVARLSKDVETLPLDFIREGFTNGKINDATKVMGEELAYAATALLELHDKLIARMAEIVDETGGGTA
jgi:hypothetical protein